MSDIRQVVGERLVEILTDYCSVNAPFADYAALIVRQGLLQEDPVKPRITILVNPGNPDNTESRPTWSDAPVNQGALPFNIAPYHIGGGTMRLLRMCIDINVCLVQSKEGREDARETGYWVLGRVEQAIEKNMGLRKADGTVLEDEFGVKGILMMLERSDPVEGGGPPNSFIWRSKVFVQVITERSAA